MSSPGEAPSEPRSEQRKNYRKSNGDHIRSAHVVTTSRRIAAASVGSHLSQLTSPAGPQTSPNAGASRLPVYLATHCITLASQPLSITLQLRLQHVFHDTSAPKAPRCTPNIPAREKLDVWLALPLIIQSDVPTSLVDNIIAALEPEHSNKVDLVQFESVSVAKTLCLLPALPAP